MSSKFALIIGNTEYTDPGLAQLTAPGKDTEVFARVLKDHNIGAFDEVNILLNQPEPVVRGAIDEFFDLKKPDDLLVLYFSGHGVRDELGALYLAVKNTNRARLRSTAVKSDYIREAMDQSRSRRQVLILDCCNSGAYAQGTKAATGVSIGTATAFEAGYGRIILTASDATQFAWEGDKVIGETDNSLFTHYLVEGLEGEADLDGDGRITVDEVYDYAYEKVRLATPRQTPSKFSSKQQGEIVLRQNMRVKDIKPISLPEELIEATEDSRTFVREGAVQQLEKLLKGKNIGLARSAREVLERIEKEDDSRRVSNAATQVLEPIRQTEKAEEERRAREEAERIAAQIAEEERIALEKAEAERKAKEEAELLLAKQKSEEERKAKKEAKRVAALKAKEVQKAREEAERTAIRKAQQERLARGKAEFERKAKDEAERLAAQKSEEERLVREEVEAERKAKEEAEKLARAKVEREATRLRAERETTEKAAREAAEKAAKEKAEREAAERAAIEKVAREKAKEESKVREKADVKGEREEFVYVIAENGTPLYHYFPASNNWNVWLEKGAKLTLTQPAVDETTIGKFGRNIKVSDEQGNEGYVRAATVRFEPIVIQNTDTERKTKAEADRLLTTQEESIQASSKIEKITFLPSWGAVFWITLGWAIGLAIGFVLGSAIGFALGWAIIGAIGGLVTAITLRIEHILSNWKSVLWITLGWAMGWAISSGPILFGYSDVINLLVIAGTTGAIGGAIGGFVMILQIRNNHNYFRFCPPFLSFPGFWM